MPNRQSLCTQTPLGPVTGPESPHQRPEEECSPLTACVPQLQAPCLNPNEAKYKGKEATTNGETRVRMSFQVPSTKAPAATFEGGPQTKPTPTPADCSHPPYSLPGVAFSLVLTQHREQAQSHRIGSWVGLTLDTPTAPHLSKVFFWHILCFCSVRTPWAKAASAQHPKI